MLMGSTGSFTKGKVRVSVQLFIRGDVYEMLHSRARSQSMQALGPDT